MCLATEQERCNECFKWENRYTGVCWFVLTDSVGHVTLMIQFRTLITNAKDIELFTRCATFFRLAFVVIFDDCFYNENDISWHGNANLHGLLSWMLVISSNISICTRYLTTCYRDGKGGRQCRNFLYRKRIWHIAVTMAYNRTYMCWRHKIRRLALTISIMMKSLSETPDSIPLTFGSCRITQVRFPDLLHFY